MIIRKIYAPFFSNNNRIFRGITKTHFWGIYWGLLAISIFQHTCTGDMHACKEGLFQIYLRIHTDLLKN
jgi:hypothetical protein